MGLLHATRRTRRPPHAMAAKPKLTYFNFPGRAEPIRIAFKLGGVEFIDNRIEGKDWPGLKPSMPWGAMPVLEVDGRTIAQSNNILRFVGRRTGLYPTAYPAEEFAMAAIDELMDACEDLGGKIAVTIPLPDGPEKLAKRKARSLTNLSPRLPPSSLTLAPGARRGPHDLLPRAL